MNVDRILETMNRCGVSYLLIGGMNFLLRHGGPLTFDVDLWIEDTEENRTRCERALTELGAEWGATEEEWGPVARISAGWLSRQPVFCLTSPEGAIDIFRSVEGLSSWRDARAEARKEATASGIPYWGLSDGSMLRSQLALKEGDRNQVRIQALRRALAAGGGAGNA
jgi:hypothetical protein